MCYNSRIQNMEDKAMKPIVTFYNNDSDHPKTTRPAHLGVNAYVEWDGKLLMEKRWDCEIWGLPGGGMKKGETERHAIAREIWEETRLRIPEEDFEKVRVYGNPGRIAAYQDGSVWRMVVVQFHVRLQERPNLILSRESREMWFFTKEELKALPIVVTHQDIVADFVASV